MASTIFNKGILPVGAIEMFAGAITQSVSSGELTTTAPEKWALCDGSAVSRTKYARLFEVIGTTYGSGDGSTTFNLPNLVGRFALGATAGGSTGTNLKKTANVAPGGSGGEAAHTLTANESGLRQHNHVVPGGGLAQDKGWCVAGSGWSVSSLTTQNAGPLDASESHNTMPPFQAVNYIIYTGEEI